MNAQHLQRLREEQQAAISQTEEKIYTLYVKSIFQYFWLNGSFVKQQYIYTCIKERLNLTTM